MGPDPNLHTHCVVLNLATRGDGSIGALHSTVLRDWKMALGAAYHAALAAGVMEAGLSIDRIGKNGTFEITGVRDDAIVYFSARRQEIVEELAQAGVESGNAAALAAAVAKATRRSKATGTASREDAWFAAARRIGLDIEEVHVNVTELALDEPFREILLAERLAGLPNRLTETRSVLDRRELFRAVGEALVGTGFGAERIETEVGRLLDDGLFVEIGRDRLGLPRYSTAEMIRIEREIVEMAAALSATQGFAVEDEKLAMDCRAKELSEEQTAAALDSVQPAMIAVVEGAPGTGKTTLLSPVVTARRSAGYRVVGASTAWRVANAMRDDLAIEARATASWLARSQQGKSFLDARTVLIVDEAGLLSSREMHSLLVRARDARAKVLFVGDRNQLQAIGAGSGMRLVARAVDTAKVQTIVRQHESWARDAVTAFDEGNAKTALDAFAGRGLLKEADGKVAAIRAIVDRVEDTLICPNPETALILAKTNAEIAALGQEVRTRLRGRGLITGPDIVIGTVNSSGHASRLSLATGDRIRFLVRNDELGVVNGTVGTITGIAPAGGQGEGTGRAVIEARVGERIVRFDTADLADEHGRAKLGWAYASTIYGAQGATVDRAAVLLTPSYDRHDIYVAASRARQETTLVVDRRRIQQEMPNSAEVSAEEGVSNRRHWLAQRLAAAHIKETTIDVAGAGSRALMWSQKAVPEPDKRIAPDVQPFRHSSRGAGHEL